MNKNVKYKLQLAMSKGNLISKRTSSYVMLPSITQNSFGSDFQKESSAEPKMTRNNKYGDFDYGSIRRDLQNKLSKRETIKIKRVN